MKVSGNSVKNVLDTHLPLTNSNKGELANPNAAYKIIAFELYFNTIEIISRLLSAID